MNGFIIVLASIISNACGCGCGLMNCPGPGNCPNYCGSGLTKAEVVQVIANVVNDYKNRGVTYKLGADGSGKGNQSDCSRFVHDVLTQIGFDVPYVNTTALGQGLFNTYFRWVPRESARAGDVILQGGHMGVFTGRNYRTSGMPEGAQMGTKGANMAPFGPGGWFVDSEKMSFYRPLKMRR